MCGSPGKKLRTVCVAISFLSSVLAGLSLADFAPGDVFREYCFVNKTYLAGFIYLSGGIGQYGESHAPGPVELPDSFDLADAVRAEVAVEFANQHEGGGQAIQVNGGAWTPIPFSAGKPNPETSRNYECQVVPLRLTDFKPGKGNTFQGTMDGSGRYTCVYGLTFRIYYDPAKKPHPTGRILTPVANAAIGEQVDVTAEGSSPNGRIKRVDYLGLYDDFSYRCDGVWRQWQYFLFHCNYSSNVGGNPSMPVGMGAPPYKATWRTSFVPDQTQPMQMTARIVDTTNMVYMTPAVTGLTFRRPGLSVALYRAQGVGGTMSNGAYGGWNTISQNFTVAGDASKISGAQIVYNTWNGWNNTGATMNGTPVAPVLGGTALAPTVTRITMSPATAVRAGQNTFTINGGTDACCVGMFVHWPGEALIVQYRTPVQVTPEQDVRHNRGRTDRFNGFRYTDLTGKKLSPAVHGTPVCCCRTGNGLPLRRTVLW